MKRHAVSHSVCRQRAVGICSSVLASPENRGLILALGLLLGITIWSHRTTMISLSSIWWNDDDSSAGQLVPLVSAFLIWHDRKRLRECPLVPCWWGGISLLVFSQVAHLYGLLYGARPSISQYGLVLTVAGLVLMVAGWQVVRRVAWILLLLCLMVPLPGVVHNLISGPLQRVATTGSVFLLEALGASVTRRGNIVMLGEDTALAVAEACSGLRMLMAFVIVAAFIAYMVRRPRWQKGVLLLSSIPVAVVCNIVRIFVTAVLILYVSSEAGDKFFHDFAGLVMMPIAVMLLFGELSLMGRIVIPESESSRPRPAHAHPQVIVSRRALMKDTRPQVQGRKWSSMSGRRQS